MEMQELGFSYRLTDFQAALGMSQLKRANDGLKRRKIIAKKYFDSTITIVKETPDIDYKPYWRNRIHVDNICDVDSSPPYIQLYANKYRCCVCKTISEYFNFLYIAVITVIAIFCIKNL